MTNRPVACGPVANLDGELSGWATTSKSILKHPSRSAQDPTIALPAPLFIGRAMKMIAFRRWRADRALKVLDKKQLLRLSRPFLEARNARRQRQAAHLHSAGPRPVFEALLSVSAGNDLDQVLADFARVPINVYHALGADTLPIDQPLAVVDGGRDDG